MFATKLSPASLIWLVVHGAVALAGILLLRLPELHALVGRGLAEGVGGSLIAGGVIGLALFVYVRSNERTLKRLEILSDAGLIAVFPFRSVRIKSEYDTHLQNAQHIDIVGYGLSAFREDYAEHFASWSRECRIRILLLDPEFPSPDLSLADRRDIEEGRPAGDTKAHVLAFEQLLSSVAGINKANFELRRMKAIPSINLFRIDDVIYWGPYLFGVQSRNTPTLLAARGGFLFSALQAHFEELWKHAGSGS
jgi:hypothetical protein